MSKRISIWGVVVLVGVVAFVTFQSLRRADGASSDRVTFKSKSGDLVQFLRDELVKYGGSVTFTSAVPSLRIEWRYAEDVKGFQILLAQSHREVSVTRSTTTEECVDQGKLAAWTRMRVYPC
jgi:hypothetical protein